MNEERDPIAFGELMMDEIGLYVDPYGRVVDQETNAALQIKGKGLKFSVDGSVNVGKNEMVFDPLNNQALANNLFGYYLNNRFNENGNNYVSNYCTVASNNDKTKGSLEVKTNEKVMSSGEYYLDSLKYADMVMQMNGSSSIDLSEFDKTPQPKKPRKG